MGMLYNTFAYRNGQLLQLDDLINGGVGPVPPVPPGPTPPTPPGPGPITDLPIGVTTNVDGRQVQLVAGNCAIQVSKRG